MNTAAPFRTLPLSDDFMFGEVMRREAICKLFLEHLLQRPIERIVFLSKQHDISDSYISHGIRLDVYLKDAAHTVYSMEMQTTGGVILFKRIRYYQGTIDRHNLEKGQHYSKLPETFIIMIHTNDIFGRGLALYKRKIVIEGCEDVSYKDGTHVYILNSSYTIGNADKAILEFLDCIRNNDIDPEHYASTLVRQVCSAVDEVRADPAKEAEYMTLQTRLMDARFEGWEEGREEGREEGLEEGIELGVEKGRKETLQNVIQGMYQARMDLSVIAQITHRSVQEVRECLEALGDDPQS